jgi:ligand-binding SRPBCC domain-containing protein
MRQFKHSFIVDAPIEAVAEFHRAASSMAAITPPPVVVRFERPPGRVESGLELDFTMWLGPLPVRWRARMEEVTSTGFIDRQLAGPFASWQHTHSFVALPDGRTEVVDEVDAALKRHPVWGPVGAFMWLNLPILFAFRGWKTRGLLERANAVPAQDANGGQG